MKINRSILLAVLGLGVAGAAQAGTVYLSGSTAVRGNIFTTLNTPGAVFTAAPTVTLYQGGGSKANYMVFSGTLVGGSGTTILQCHWSGSDGGVDNVALAGTTNPNRLTDFVTSGIDGTDHGASLPPTTANHEVDLAMTDNIFTYAHAYGDPGSEGLTSAPADLANGTQVGIVTFKWLRNNGLWTGGNVTSSMIRQSLGGFAVRAVFDGNSTHTGDYVYVSGRTKDSGTRCNALGDSGYGVFKPVTQITMDSSGNMTGSGDVGFTSGGTLAGTMGADTTTKADTFNTVTGYSVIAYLGFNDANTALGLGTPAHELTYNGVAWSVANIEEGTYTFWGNEYIYTSNIAGTEAQSVYNLMAAAIPAHLDGQNAIPTGNMHTSKNNPETDPSHF
jgi:hypothetical protein